MSDNDGLKRQLEAIQKQLKQMRVDMAEVKVLISEANVSIADAVVNVLEGRISEIERDVEQSMISDIRWKWSFFSLLFSIFLSALIGVVGNWFVSLWFQPHSEAIIDSLMISGGLLIGIIAALIVMMIRIYREIKQQP